MSSNSMLPKGTFRLILWGWLPVMAFGQHTPLSAPVPRDPLELATGPIRTATSPTDRDAALQLLTRARSNFALRSGGQGYDLKASFAADSLGATNYDGSWEMEDLFAPRIGHRWTA